MLYRRLADVVVLIHGLACVYFFLGAFLAWRYPWTALVHIPLGIWVGVAFVMGWTCPLTPLENRLRTAGRSRGYEGSFVDHYIAPLVGLTPAPAAGPAGRAAVKAGRRNEIILGVFFCILTLVPHGANLEKYHDAIWPPPVKPAGPRQGMGERVSLASSLPAAIDEDARAEYRRDMCGEPVRVEEAIEAKRKVAPRRKKAS